MTNEELDQLIESAMETGIVHNLIPESTRQLMRARLNEVRAAAHQTHEPDDWKFCLMCAVRAMTEGRAPQWITPDLEPGSTVTGVVLRMGQVPTRFGEDKAPFTDLWTDGADRVRITGMSLGLRNALDSAEPQVGDTLTVTYEGVHLLEHGPYRGHETKRYSVQVERGHH
jgi:hypothetical protein